ncbi:hypothetical protein E2L08_12555 [Palleronia sediminis]|uniref:Uncharacterized protein n=1 Tax=Palleronia sediminis TaxID=2547833 RepID=A0A4R6A5Z2_9RHOB|nr:hypothetical protein [Palleronia sediminis]TDL78124.1 hypothetical protein E2L08_12555 [Palleronia sediminis]
MNKIEEITPSVSRTYNLPLVEDCSRLPEAPRFQDNDWKPLPERFLAGIEFASRFTAIPVNGPHTNYIAAIHVSDTRAIATDNKTLVEFDLGGEVAYDMSLTVQDMRVLRSFGASPSHVGRLDGRDIRLHFRWATGTALALRPMGRTAPAVAKSMVTNFDWSDMNPVDAHWRGQIVGQFSIKPVRDTSDLLHVHPDRIESSTYTDESQVCLPFTTHSPVYTVYDRPQIIRAIKIAERIKFVERAEGTYFLFCAEKIRGVLASMVV